LAVQPQRFSVEIVGDAEAEAYIMLHSRWPSLPRSQILTLSTTAPAAKIFVTLMPARMATHDSAQREIGIHFPLQRAASSVTGTVSRRGVITVTFDIAPSNVLRP
jgi:hypothetical protein